MMEPTLTNVEKTCQIEPYIKYDITPAGDEAETPRHIRLLMKVLESNYYPGSNEDSDLGTINYALKNPHTVFTRIRSSLTSSNEIRHCIKQSVFYYIHQFYVDNPYAIPNLARWLFNTEKRFIDTHQPFDPRKIEKTAPSQSQPTYYRSKTSAPMKGKNKQPSSFASSFGLNKQNHMKNFERCCLLFGVMSGFVFSLYYGFQEFETGFYCGLLIGMTAYLTVHVIYPVLKNSIQGLINTFNRWYYGKNAYEALNQPLNVHITILHQNTEALELSAEELAFIQNSSINLEGINSGVTQRINPPEILSR